MNEDKYYTPDLEDLRAGYKCEYNKNIIGAEEWEAHTCYSWEIETWDYNNPEKWIRTKYLDKEDIESLGWNTNHGYEEFSRYFDAVDGTIYKMTFALREKWLDHINKRLAPLIEIWDTNFENCVYNGECPSINELKFLMKLLNIK